MTKETYKTAKIKKGKYLHQLVDEKGRRTGLFFSGDKRQRLPKVARKAGFRLSDVSNGKGLEIDGSVFIEKEI